jgi:putative methionine-R-sulfoxide reductase with GAF domain
MSVPDPTLVLSGVGASLRGVWRFAGRPGPATFLAAGSVALLIVLAAVDAGGRAAWWERAHLTLSAVLALYVAGGSLRRTAGRTHEVRGWISFACAGWLASELLRDVEALGFNVPIPPDFVLVVVIAAAAAAYRADLRDRFRFVEEISVYLDAAIVSAAAAAGFLLLFAVRGPDPYDPMLLVYGLVFLSLLGATAILDLAVLAELRAKGAYAILAGLGLLAIGFLGRSGTTDPSTRWAFASLISAGVLAVGYGTATWTDVVDANPRYARLATRIRDLIPLAAISFVPVILIRAEGLADGLPLRTAIDGCIAVVVLAAILRQSALLAERGRVLAGLSTALAAAERRAQQVAGIEEGGRVLALSGATSLALHHVATSLADRFGYAHVAIYVGDGPDLEPRVAHGIRTLDPPLHGARGIVGRVVDTHRPAFVPDVTRDPDYVSGDEQVKGEICVPLLDGERFLGVLDVQTTRLEPLDDSDLAAALAPPPFAHAVTVRRGQPGLSKRPG